MIAAQASDARRCDRSLKNQDDNYLTILGIDRNKSAQGRVFTISIYKIQETLYPSWFHCAVPAD